MPHPLFSVRFPAPLAQALDNWAAERQCSRSGLVETIITTVTADDRDEILGTQVVGGPTVKLNLRLRSETLDHLKQLAGDLRPADFLRRTMANVLGDTVDQDAASDDPAAAQPGRGGAIQSSEAHVALIRLFALALVAALAALVWVFLRLRHRPSEPYEPPDPLPPSPDPEPRGQLSAETEPGALI
jgi:hypothetical protein